MDRCSVRNKRHHENHFRLSIHPGYLGRRRELFYRQSQHLVQLSPPNALVSQLGEV